MGVKIEPREITDRGGYLTMPLRQNVPDPADDAWGLTTCPKCGRECWERPLTEGLTEDLPEGMIESDNYQGYDGGLFEYAKTKFGYAYGIDTVDVYGLIPRFEIGGK